MGMLDVAKDCLGRGWFVFPCKARGKEPLVPGGFKAATQDNDRVNAWWGKWPDANVGIATGASGLTVLDIDHGLMSAVDLRNYQTAKGLPETYTVRTGRRDGFGVQLYFKGEGLKSIAWEDIEAFPDTVSGDVRGGTGYVLAAGSLHPSGAFYEALVEAPIAPVPAFVRALKSPSSLSAIAALGPDEKIRIGRHDALMSMGGSWRAKGMPAEALADAMLATNAARVDPPLEEDDVLRMAANIAKFAIHDDGPEVVFGKQIERTAVDPWAKYHTADQIVNAPPVTFLIDGFLTEDAITVIAAPVAQRKSILALNVVHSLLTGESLFGHFAVSKRPSRVLYCCPEMGIQSFSARLSRMGLAPYLGETLFCTTMASDPFELKDITPPELKGAVVVLDTAIRFLKGNESDSAEMAIFAATVFRLIKDGAASVLMLHHSKKGTGEAAELTLDNAMRGSGELGAFVACVWATRLQDGKDEYRTPSYLENVKKRDFDSKPFQVLPVEGSYRLVYDGGGDVVLSSPSRFKRDKDGKESLALDVIVAARQTHPRLSYLELSRMLKDHGIERSPEWIRKFDKRSGSTTTGATLSNSHPTTNTP